MLPQTHPTSLRGEVVARASLKRTGPKTIPPALDFSRFGAPLNTLEESGPGATKCFEASSTSKSDFVCPKLGFLNYARSTMSGKGIWRLSDSCLVLSYATKLLWALIFWGCWAG